MTSQHYREIFCKRLKQARQANGLSQKTLGILAGIDEFVASTRINRYEKGVHEPDIDTAQRLAKVLDTPLAFFYTDDDNLAEIIINYNDLSIDIKQSIYSIIHKSIKTKL